MQVLIDDTNKLLTTYEQYNNGSDVTRRPPVAIETSIGVIVAYFKNSGCVLAAELLTHMIYNETLNSTYTPYFGKLLVLGSGGAIVGPIRNSASYSGSGEFLEATSSKDLYYAIHLFNWTKDRNTKQITISDRYDFDYNDKYNGLAGTAINFLAKAEERGEILPFYTRITFA